MSVGGLEKPLLLPSSWLRGNIFGYEASHTSYLMHI